MKLGLVGRRLLQTGPGTLRHAVHRSRCRAQQLSDLRCPPAQHVARISTARCRAGRYCKAAIRASRVLCRDAMISAGSAAPALTSASGMGSSHGTSGRPAASGASGYSPGRQGRTATVGGRRSPARAGRSWSRPVQPGPQRRQPRIAVGPPGPDHGLLHLVFRIVDRTQHAVAVRQQLRPERVGETREILVIAIAAPPASRAAPSLVQIRPGRETNRPATSYLLPDSTFSSPCSPDL